MTQFLRYALEAHHKDTGKKPEDASKEAKRTAKPVTS